MAVCRVTASTSPSSRSRTADRPTLSTAASTAGGSESEGTAVPPRVGGAQAHARPHLDDLADPEGRVPAGPDDHAPARPLQGRHLVFRGRRLVPGLAAPLVPEAGQVEGRLQAEPVVQERGEDLDVALRL